VRRAVWLLLIVACFNGCGGSPANRDLASRLVSQEDLPGAWVPYSSANSAPTTDLCGRPRSADPVPIETQRAAFAIDPVEGPIYGERIERYGSPAEAERRVQLASDLPLPCDQDGEEGRWRTTADTPIRLGADAHLYLTRKPDDTGSFNYTGVFRDGSVVISFVVNTYSSDRPRLERLMTITWEQATQHR
jgi:hypothetical protein